MVATGRVQIGGGNRTYVVHPPDPPLYHPPDAVSARFVAFDVPAIVLRPGGHRGWFFIPGPGSLFAKLSPITEMPHAERITWIASRI